jgi:hypothetical protein
MNHDEVELQRWCRYTSQYLTTIIITNIIYNNTCTNNCLP